MSESRNRPALGPCSWCDKPAYEELITTLPRRKRKTTPVCDEHARYFERTAGLLTVNEDLNRKARGDT